MLMLSIQAERGLTRLREPGIVPGIISFSIKFLQYLLSLWCDYIMLASLL